MAIYSTLLPEQTMAIYSNLSPEQTIILQVLMKLTTKTYLFKKP
jgi:hypothetical protein